MCSLRGQSIVAQIEEESLESTKSPGALLQKLRLRNEWSIEDVASNLNLRTEVIAALEVDDYSQLPETTFIRGYIRAYARLLGIREEEVLEPLPDHYWTRATLGSVLPVMGGAELKSAQHRPKISVFKTATRGWVRAALLPVAVILVILVAWWLSGLRPSTINGNSSIGTLKDGTSTRVVLPADSKNTVSSTED